MIPAMSYLYSQRWNDVQPGYAAKLHNISTPIHYVERSTMKKLLIALKRIIKDARVQAAQDTIL
jgi:TRAP-type C4-dicarboxylate transport system substrate-binding protein